MGRLARYENLKRIIDWTIALTALALFLPLWVLIALFIKGTSKGPVIFRNTVVGKGEQPFTYYKFRTMYHHSNEVEHHRFLERFVREGKPFTQVDNGNGQKADVYKVVDDPRITPFGRLLRKSSLDEIPQMINVLRGEMSIVGPRPPIWHEYLLYDEEKRQRLQVTPGLTGLYQVTARSQVPFQDMLQIDLDYIRRRSLALDLSIILKTFFVIASTNGAG
jgi:lipopolysaccharide/colanic/teichoic acid biosynthesis glycosyltransferase